MPCQWSSFMRQFLHERKFKQLESNDSSNHDSTLTASTIHQNIRGLIAWETRTFVIPDPGGQQKFHDGSGKSGELKLKTSRARGKQSCCFWCTFCFYVFDSSCWKTVRVINLQKFLHTNTHKLPEKDIFPKIRNP